MALESATYIDELVNTNPVGTDSKSQGDDHLRLIKSVLLNSFPNISGAMNASDVELNYLVGQDQDLATGDNVTFNHVQADGDFRAINSVYSGYGLATGGGAVGRMWYVGDDWIFRPTDGAGGYDFSNDFFYDFSATRWAFDADMWVGGTATLAAIAGAAIGSDVQAWSADLDTYAANPLAAGELQQLQNIGAVTIAATQWAGFSAYSAAQWTALNLITAGELGELDTYASTPLTAAELQQLQNINSVTINNTKWTYLGNMNQNVRTTDNVTFASVNVGGGSALTNFADSQSWTPGISFGGGTTGITYSSRSGKWTRMNNCYICTGTIALSNKGSSTGIARITGFPASVNSDCVGLVIMESGASGLSSNVMLDIDGAADTAVPLREQGASSDSNINEGHFTNSTELSFTLIFHA